MSCQLVIICIFFQDSDCSMFKEKACNQDNSTVLVVDTGISSISECQVICGEIRNSNHKNISR